MSGVLGLPSLWVFIEYEDGRKENVGNTNTLDADKEGNIIANKYIRIRLQGEW